MNHQDIDRRSLMMHRIIAARLRSRPELMAVAHANIARWDCPERGWWQEWSAILSSQTVEEIATLIERDDEEACRMRQSAPFAGILTPREVWDLKRQFKHELKQSAPEEGRHSPDQADRMSALLTQPCQPMNYQETDRRSPMMHRIVGSALSRGQLVLFLAFFVVTTAVASFVPIIATMVDVLLTLLLVLFLNLITFRGDIAQDLVLKLTRYFVRQHPKTTGSDTADI